MDIVTFTILFASSMFIGILAVLMGGTLFLSFPLFQILFPEMTFAAIVGNIKIGSVFRNLAALKPTYHLINKDVLYLVPALCFGSIIGSWQVLSFDTWVIPLVLVIGLIVQEFGKYLTVPRPLLVIITIAIGVYGGIFGAGIMLLILSLLRLTHQSIADARVNALMLEMLVSAVAVVMFWQATLIDWPIALTWAAGSVLGGYIGGITIKKTVHWKESTQTWLVRSAFLIALVVAVGKISTE